MNPQYRPAEPAGLLRAAILCALLGFSALVPVFTPGCITTPSARVIEARTLLVVGHAAESAVSLTAQLYRDGKITADKAKAVADFYDRKFQPAFRIALGAAHGADISTIIASPDLVSLLGQLTALLPK